MAATQIDLIIEQNSVFYQSVIIQDAYSVAINITDWSFSGSIRIVPTDDVLASFSFTTTSPQTGNLTMYIPPAITLSLPATTEFNFYRYDVLANTPTGGQIRLFYGNVFVRDAITY